MGREMNSPLDVHQSRILVVDDESGIRRLLGMELRAAGYGDVTLCSDSRKVAELYREHRYELILLDLHMPNLDGYQVMSALKEIETDGYLPVLVITAEPKEKMKALRAGAKDFVTKPFERAELLTRVKNLLEVRLLYRRLRDYSGDLEDKVRERTARLTGSYHETLRTMTRAAEYRDDTTGAHVRRISFYSRELAERIGMDGGFCERIFHASPMHDIGKIGIPDSILLKKGPLTNRQWEVMRMHTMIGARMLMDGESPYLQMGAQIAAAHHERWDGSGYPRRLREQEIPLGARILAVVDAYDSMVSGRPYRAPKSREDALAELEREAGAQFDPEVVQAMTRVAGSCRVAA